MHQLEKKEKMKFAVIGVLILIDLFIFSLFFSLNTHGALRVVFLDVGQGDAIFVQTPSGKQFLVDTGYNNSVLRGLDRQMSVFDRSIDAVFITHPDSDHIGGVIDVMKNYSVAHYFDSGFASDTDLYESIGEIINVKKIKSTSLTSYDIVDFGDGVFLDILWPDTELTDFQGDTNDGSLVMKLIYGNNSFLLTGDASKKTEKVLVFKKSRDLDSDVLKVGHHGSKTSSLESFISAVSPSYSVISAGQNNKFGHPHAEVVEILKNIGTEILETFTLKDIVFVSDGEKLNKI